MTGDNVIRGVLTAALIAALSLVFSDDQQEKTFQKIAVKKQKGKRETVPGQVSARDPRQAGMIPDLKMALVIMQQVLAPARLAAMKALLLMTLLLLKL